MKKSKKNIVYSTNPDFEFEYDADQDQEDVPANQQRLKIYPDRRNRKGKTVTVVNGFSGSHEALKGLEKQLKSHCGTGGTVKDGDIQIQGNFVQKVNEFLRKEGYNTVVSGV